MTGEQVIPVIDEFEGEAFSRVLRKAHHGQEKLIRFPRHAVFNTVRLIHSG